MQCVGALGAQRGGGERAKEEGLGVEDLKVKHSKDLKGILGQDFFPMTFLKQILEDSIGIGCVLDDFDEFWMFFGVILHFSLVSLLWMFEDVLSCYFLFSF